MKTATVRQPTFSSLTQRIANQERRINEGVRSGSLTDTEAASLRERVKAAKAGIASMTIVVARERIGFCTTCGALTEKSPCAICADGRRDSSLICVVERAVDILSVEKSGTFRGKFHVLGGKISPLDGVEPEDLSIAELEKRLKVEAITEIVIALGTDVEGDATSHYLAKRLARHGLRVSRIAYGLPAGSGLEFADELTMSRALEGRREMK